MDKNTRLLFLFVFYLIISPCSADLTGAHYLHTINCSSPSLYIPQGPYLFNHHWPFTSITIQYEKQLTRGACYRDGSLYFVLGTSELCSGVYYGGRAKLLCQFDDDEYCLIAMITTDGGRLTCDGSEVKLMAIQWFICLLLICFINKNSILS